MPSSIGWLDSSNADAERARVLLGALDEAETVDPLGLGSVRDATADLLFPGISTVQTRGRYFLFVPWIMQMVASEGPPLRSAIARNRDLHIGLIKALAANDGGLGIIGRIAGKDVKQLPSTVYWSGLGSFGILERDWSQTTYLSNVQALRRHTARRDTDDETMPPIWHPDLPPAPDNFPNGATLALRDEESEFLIERVHNTRESSLLDWLLWQRVRIDAGEDLPWMISRRAQFPVALEWLVHIAETFSEAVLGPQLRYNLDVATLLGIDHLIDFYREELSSWEAGPGLAAAANVRALPRAEFWVMVRAQRAVPSLAQQFVDRWFNLLATDGPQAVHAPRVGEMIVERELQIKRRRARLTYLDAREAWSGASGAQQLTFRWQQARTIVNDIVGGLD